MTRTQLEIRFKMWLARCTSIINFPIPSAGQVHGCPFKVMDKDMLKKAVEYWGCDPKEVPNVMRKAANKEYQMACKSFYCGCHDGDTGEVGNFREIKYKCH